MNKHLHTVCFLGIALLVCCTAVLYAEKDSLYDSPLEQNLDEYFKTLKENKDLTSSDQISVAVYDLSSEKTLVSINEDRQTMAADFVNNYIMLLYFHEVKQGRLTHSNTNRHHLDKMIRYSSNTSTNYIIRKIGGPSTLNRRLKAIYPYFKQTKIIEYIPTNGRAYRNSTSLQDLNRFYKQLWHNNLPYSNKMKYYLQLPNNDNNFKQTRIPSSTKVYNKTINVYGLAGVSGIFLLYDSNGNPRPYVFTGLIEDKTKTNTHTHRIPIGAWVNQRAKIMRGVSERVYDYIYKSYGDKFPIR